MNNIKILPTHEAQKIAAGEVVERPANGVKELLENALDAQATRIDVYIEKAGKQLICIRDNGCGMSLDDATLCVLPHATSKLRTLHDLESINTFGFRGEALASLAAISNLTLITRSKESKHGHKLIFKASKLEHQEQIACPVGTEISIKNLFYNVPVRKKFLKQDETEWNQIQNILFAAALSNLNVHISLWRDSKRVLNSPAVKNVQERCSQLWGHNIASNLIKLNHSKSKAPLNKIYGYISQQHFWRYRRDLLFFFVNNRWIKDMTLSRAVIKGYADALPSGKFPAVFLFLEIDPSTVDVNVHPKKEEVRFTHPVALGRSIQNLVTSTLQNYINEQLQTSQIDQHSSAQPLQQTSALIKEQTITDNKHLVLQNNILKKSHSDQDTYLETPSIQAITTHSISTPHIQNETISNTPTIENASTLSALQNKQSQNMSNNKIYDNQKNETIGAYRPKIIGQLFDTYILIQNENKFIMIDQHAAHERILYEKFLTNFEKKEGTRLLFPEIILLPSTHIQLVMQEQDFFSDQGIELRQLGENKISLITCPPSIQNNSVCQLIKETAEFMLEYVTFDRTVFRKKLNEHMHGQMACKSAIKAGDKLDIDQAQKIIADLLIAPNRFKCVHGRPTMWTLGRDEIEKKFRRR